MQAIEYEARRQIEMIEEGGTIEQETRLFDTGRGDDPADALQGGGARLPLFPRSRSAAAGARSRLGRRGCAPSLPELPDAKKARFIADYGLSADDAGVLVAEKETALVFRAGRRRARSQGGGQLGDGRSVRRAEPARGRASSNRRSRPSSSGH